MGGENPCPALTASLSWGSSPRGRGKRSYREAAQHQGRLIPAWAGKTTLSSARVTPVPAHPRVGGENEAQALSDGALYGSSPRGRGKPPATTGYPRRRRLIPAWAGKTITEDSDTQANRAHPRVGGENLKFLVSATTETGSSPRGRGKPSGRRQRRRTCRLIPAWAGKTCHRAARCRRLGAHPRVGGENRLSVSTMTSRGGSSPRGRGKQEV